MMMMTIDKPGKHTSANTTRQNGIERKQRERNWKRLILVGAFAGFAAFSGLISVHDELSGDALRNPGLSSPAVGQDQELIVPRIRTRTS